MPWQFHQVMLHRGLQLTAIDWWVKCLFRYANLVSCRKYNIMGKARYPNLLKLVGGKVDVNSVASTSGMVDFVAPAGDCHVRLHSSTSICRAVSFEICCSVANCSTQETASFKIDLAFFKQGDSPKVRLGLPWHFSFCSLGTNLRKGNPPISQQKLEKICFLVLTPAFFRIF